MMSKSKRIVSSWSESSWSELFDDKKVILSGLFFLGALSLRFSPLYYAQILDALHRALTRLHVQNVALVSPMVFIAALVILGLFFAWSLSKRVYNIKIRMDMADIVTEIVDISTNETTITNDTTGCLISRVSGPASSLGKAKPLRKIKAIMKGKGFKGAVLEAFIEARNKIEEKKKQSPDPDQVIPVSLAGHSRGAMIAALAARLLHAVYKDQISISLSMYDPVWQVGSTSETKLTYKDLEGALQTQEDAEEFDQLKEAEIDEIWSAWQKESAANESSETDVTGDSATAKTNPINFKDMIKTLPSNKLFMGQTNLTIVLDKDYRYYMQLPAWANKLGWPELLKDHAVRLNGHHSCCDYDEGKSGSERRASPQALMGKVLIDAVHLFNVKDQGVQVYCYGTGCADEVYEDKDRAAKLKDWMAQACPSGLSMEEDCGLDQEETRYKKCLLASYNYYNNLWKNKVKIFNESLPWYRSFFSLPEELAEAVDDIRCQGSLNQLGNGCLFSPFTKVKAVRRPFLKEVPSCQEWADNLSNVGADPAADGVPCMDAKRSDSLNSSGRNVDREGYGSFFNLQELNKAGSAEQEESGRRPSLVGA
jgi:hypothetical protein